MLNDITSLLMMLSIFLFLLAIWTSSLGNFLLKSFIEFNFHEFSVGCHFAFLLMFFEAEMILILMKSYLCIFSSDAILSVWYPRKYA